MDPRPPHAGPMQSPILVDAIEELQETEPSIFTLRVNLLHGRQALRIAEISRQR